MTNYIETIKKIAELKRLAEKQRKVESGAILKEIRRQITQYGFTAEELGLVSPASKGQRIKKSPLGGAKGKPTIVGSKGAAARKVPVRYKDSDGNTWTGRGRMPRWMVAALKNEGTTLDSLRIKPDA